VIREGFDQAVRASRIIRNASLYVAVLFVILLGAGVLTELGVESWIDGASGLSFAADTVPDAVIRAQLILVIGVVASLMVLVDGTAIGMTLVASRAVGRPVGLRSAVQRARQVFWRLVAATFLIALLEVVASALYHLVIRAGTPDATDFTFYRVDPVPGTLVSIPFVLTTTAIILADDSVGAALRRSASLARRSVPIAIALALFGLAFGYIGGLAANEGLGLLLRATEAIHLDITRNTASFLIAAGLGLALVSAFGSILFTAQAVISATQATAFIRFGVPMAGLARVTPESEAPPDTEVLADIEPLASTPGVTIDSGPAAQAVAIVDSAEPPSPPAAAPATPEASAPSGLDPVAVGPSPAAVWERYQAQRDGRPDETNRTRWISIQMRLLGAFLWIVAIASVLIGPPR
jgi:hypothetical protein